MADLDPVPETGGADEPDPLFSDSNSKLTGTPGDAQAKGGLFGDEKSGTQAGERGGSPIKRQGEACWRSSHRVLNSA